MYVFFVREKTTNTFVIPNELLFLNRYDVHKIVNKIVDKFPAERFTYHLFSLSKKKNLFNEDVFLKKYKPLYLEEHNKNPQLYPLTLVKTCIFQRVQTFPMQANDIPKYAKINIRRFLLDSADLLPVDTRLYKSSNCIIYESQLHLYCKELIVSYYNKKLSEEDMFLCVKHTVTKGEEVIYVCNDLMQAVDVIITSIIKNHEFYIEDEFVNITYPYYLYRVNIKDDEYMNTCLFSHDWYNVIMSLSSSLDKTSVSLEEDTQIKVFLNNYQLCQHKHDLPPILLEELNGLLNLAIKR